MKEWFQSWFDSPYYHILYKHRDESEAAQLIDNLLNFLNPAKGSDILDIACGKGRHSIYLAGKGFRVTGLDLSQQNILSCRKYENDNLEFYEHDMREIFRTNNYDVALNLFTSFGYFDREHDNLRALRSAALALKPGGYFVLDYFNPVKVSNSSAKSISKTIDGIDFSIVKETIDGRVNKFISFQDKGQTVHFKESVQLITEEKFRDYFEQTSLKVLKVFGDYNLNSYETDSPRLIFITQKVR
ncbi:MAG: Cypemycin methyltransferase [Bacteroidetes bacterium ADurb.Bin141]|nr:MAG: methyltransferase [Bacteroidetes bacterium OLB10]MBE7509006.1 class I SAM-dependent methyltransferase [Bacteroidia bacterium]MCB0849217.1 class I SAM-dependent methyltransferase [Bacteroidota bacterium]MCE7954341.1 class I SAM-dependent methyltransferase [Bacteroidetes bacterium CHB6]OQB65938.1 MAG: Cypemycin methyltransferase [Bacteroidetes bacterium ADurb.Bin141]